MTLLTDTPTIEVTATAAVLEVLADRPELRPPLEFEADMAFNWFVSTEEEAAELMTAFRDVGWSTGERSAMDEDTVWSGRLNGKLLRVWLPDLALQEAAAAGEVIL